MKSTKTHKDIFIDIDEHRTIESNFRDNFESGFIALHPFYKKVFHDDFDYRRHLKDTFHLIESVTWDKVRSDLKFQNTNQLAKAILGINQSDYRELKEFLEFKRLLFPAIDEDTVPEILLSKFLKHLIGQGIKEVITGYSKHTIFEEDRQDKKIEINKDTIFEVIGKLQQKLVVKEERMGIALLLPDHDCPYTLILGDKRLVNSFITDFEIEGFWVDKKTNFNWWTE